MADMNELGSTGLKRSGGRVHEEFLRELQGGRATEVFKEMSNNDPVVGAVLFAIEMLMRQVIWRVEAASDSQIALQAAAFVESAMNDMSQTWEDFISEVLTMLPFGWSYHEVVYKQRKGPMNPDSNKKSKFDDGKIGWKKIPIRGQDTLDQWLFDEHGGIQGMTQQPPPDYLVRTIPIQKALLFRTSTKKNNPEGRSVLRNGYRPWFLKKHIENIEAIGIERDLAGLPMAMVPPEIFASGASEDEKRVLEKMKEIVTNIRRDEQEGIVFPLAYDENGKELYQLKLLNSGGSRQFNTSEIINRYDQRIAMTVLADFILLGHEKVGSFALASSKTNLFSTAIGAWMKSIAAVLNRHAIPPLMNLNNFPAEEQPILVPGDIENVDLVELGDYITKLAGAGVALFPNKELETHLMQQANLPLPKDDEAEE